MLENIGVVQVVKSSEFWGGRDIEAIHFLHGQRSGFELEKVNNKTLLLISLWLSLSLGNKIQDLGGGTIESSRGSCGLSLGSLEVVLGALLFFI